MSESNDSPSMIVSHFSYNRNDPAASGLSPTIGQRYSVSLKTQNGFRQFSQEMSTPNPQGILDSAGSELALLFAPYSTASSNTNLPNFEAATPASTAPGQLDLMPFYFNYAVATSGQKYFDMTHPSGTIAIDSAGDLISGPVNPVEGHKIRHNYDIRGIGLRLPMIGVGWGYDTDGNPFPAGTQSGKFAGNVTYGRQVDPKDYVAAPIDIRYDTTKKMWVASADGMSLHQHLENVASDGGPAFATFFADDLAEASGLGYHLILPSLTEIPL